MTPTPDPDPNPSPSPNQVTRRGPTPTHPYSYEIMDCRLQGSAEANMTWASACPPPGVTLRSGMPAEAERFAPALEGKQLRAQKGPATAIRSTATSTVRVNLGV